VTKTFAEKNAQRRLWKSRVAPRAYREARALRRSKNGCFGNESQEFWAEAAVGTYGSTYAGGVLPKKKKDRDE